MDLGPPGKLPVYELKGALFKLLRHRGGRILPETFVLLDVSGAFALSQLIHQEGKRSVLVVFLQLLPIRHGAHLPRQTQCQAYTRTGMLWTLLASPNH